MGRLRYLQSIAFRACRLVVDTGLHAKRWTREQAIQWFATTEINRLRAQAQQALGPKFDYRRFNDALVTGGGMLMVVLARKIDAHIRELQET